jgi:hypothetical protein
MKSMSILHAFNLKTRGSFMQPPPNFNATEGKHMPGSFLACELAVLKMRGKTKQKRGGKAATPFVLLLKLVSDHQGAN